MQQIGVFLFGLLLALGYWPGTMDAPLTLRWCVAAVGIPLLLLSTTNARRAPGSFGWVLLACCLFPGITLFYSPDWLGGLDEWLHLLILAGAAYWASTARLDAFWRGLAIGIGVSALLAVGQRFWGFSWVDQAAPPSGLFGNRNMLAEAGVVAFIYAAHTKRGLLLGLAALAVLVPLSRGALGALVLSMAVFYWSRWPLASRAILYGLAVALVVSFALVDDSVTLRLLAWSSVLSDFRFLGHGLGGYAATFPLMEYAHSEPIQALYELGVMALPALLLLCAALFLGDRNAHEYYILVALVAVSFLSFPFHMPLTAMAAAVSAGKLVADGLRVRVVQPPRSILTGGSGKSDKAAGGTAGTCGQGRKDIPALCSPPKAQQSPT